jgi:hypothetical protein
MKHVRKSGTKNAHVTVPGVGLHIKWPLRFSYLSEQWNDSIFFREIIQYQISRKLIPWFSSCYMSTYRQKEIFRIRPDRPWDLPSLLYNGYRVFPGGKAAGAWC